MEVQSLDHARKWKFEARAHKGDKVSGGDIIGVVQEDLVVEHRIMVPPTLSGEITAIKSGEYTLDENRGHAQDKRRRDGQSDDAAALARCAAAGPTARR